MGQFTVPNEAQQQLALRTGVDPEQFVVVLENESCLRMLHSKSRNYITIHKSEKEVRMYGSK